MEGEPRLVLVLQDVETANYQDFSSCSNCYESLSPDSVRLRLTDPLQKSTSYKSNRGTPNTTILEALDVIFEIKKKSCFSKLILDEDRYALCGACADLLADLHIVYVQFIKRTHDPSFMNSVLVQNKSLMKNRASWTEIDDQDGYSAPTVEFKIEQEDLSDYDPLDDWNGGDTWMQGDENSDSDSSEVFGHTVASGRSTRAEIKRLPPTRANVKKLLSKVRAELPPKPSKGQRRRKYECSECAACFLRSNALKTHAGVHAQRKYFCPFCKGGFRTIHLVERHVNCFHQLGKDGQQTYTKYNPKLHVCPECEKVFPKASALLEHSRVHSSANFKCEHCGVGYRSKTALTLHMSSVNDGTVNQRWNVDGDPAAICPIESRTEESSDDEENIVSAEKPSCTLKSKRLRKYACSECPATFVRTDHLRRHAAQHSEKTIVCKICHAGFKKLNFLERHLVKVHGGDRMRSVPENTTSVRKPQKKRFSCKECDSCFSRNSNLKVHLANVHQIVEETPMTCDICGLVLASEDRFQRHMDKAHRPTVFDNRYTCEFCGKNYKNKDSLRKHRICHREDELAFNCDTCNYSTKYRYLLTRHREMVHVGTKTHLCPTCGASFKSKHHLRLHAVRHEEKDVRPFGCTQPGCTKSFRRQANLHQHLQLHKGAKFTCTECGASFSRNGYLKVHMETVHLGLREKSESVNRRKKRKMNPSSPPALIAKCEDGVKQNEEENLEILPGSPQQIHHFQILDPNMDPPSEISFVMLNNAYSFCTSDGDQPDTDPFVS